jgi:hypothetical protein
LRNGQTLQCREASSPLLFLYGKRIKENPAGFTVGGGLCETLLIWEKPMEQIFNKKNAARALNISVETLDRYKKNGRLPYHLIGDRVIYTETDLNFFLKSCAVPATVIPTPREKQAMAKAAGGAA